MEYKNSIKRGAVYFADLSGYYGSEQGGFRPVVIIQNNIGNKYSPTTLIAPLTSSLLKKQLPTHVFLSADEYGLQDDSIVLCEQIRVIDKKRLKDLVCQIGEEDMSEIDNAISISFGLVNASVA